MVSALIVFKNLLNSPTEATTFVLINSFQNQQDAADFEDSGANEGGHAAPNKALLRKSRPRADKR